MSETDYRHLCLISGGKDSTALALWLKDNYPDMDVEYVFCDTKKELPETYEFLTRIEAYLGQEIVRLCGEENDRGFDHFLKVYGDFLPAANMRWCTKNLKIKPLERYIGDDPAKMYIGLRADEHRTGYVSTKDNIEPVFPFQDEGLVKDDILQILDESGVGLPDYYEWRTRSGCYFCFFQRKEEWVGLKEEHPELFKKAKEYEKPEEGFTWMENESLDELEDPERMQEIKEQAEKRKERLREKQNPSNLAQAFGYEDLDDPDEGIGCMICHV